MKRTLIYFLLSLIFVPAIAQDNADDTKTFFEAVAKNDTLLCEQILEKHSIQDVYNENGRTALCIAVESGYLELTQILIKHKAAVNLPVKKTLVTPLFLAVKTHNMFLTKFLLKNGADPNLADSSGTTPLIKCCINNDYEIIKWLLYYGADIHKTTNYGNTALELACWSKSNLSAQILMIRGANLNSQGSRDQGTPLIYALMKKEYMLATELIWKGANIHAENNLGDGILHIVAKDTDFISNSKFKHDPLTAFSSSMSIQDSIIEQGYYTLFEYLVSLKIDIYHRNKNGYQPLHFACFNNNNGLILELIRQNKSLNDHKNIKSATPLICALRNNHPRAAFNLQFKSDVQLADTEQWTALHYAARDNYISILRYCLEKKANVNARNRNLWTPLHLAAHNGNNNAVRLLLYFGALDTFKNSNGKTAMQLALDKNLTETVDLLQNKIMNPVDLFFGGLESYIIDSVKKSGDLSSVNQFGQNMLHAALIRGSLDFAEWLVLKGIDINAMDKSGLTPLIISASLNQGEFCELLIKKGALVTAFDTTGMTALHYAIIHQDTFLIRLLIEKHADVNKRQMNEGTPLETACWHQGNLDIVKTLVLNGALINPSDFNDWSPLQLCIRQKHFSAARWLLEQGANVKYKNSNGVNILHDIIGKELQILLMECLNRGANPNETTIDSLITPLHLATMNNSIYFVKLLYWNGADTNLKMIDGKRPIDIAEAKGNLDIARFLKHPTYDLFELLAYNQDQVLQRMIDQKTNNFNIKNSEGLPFLHALIQSNNRELIDKAMVNGADQNITDTFGQTPLLYALYIGNTFLAKRFIEKGADLNLASNVGETPYSLALRRNYTEVLKILKDKKANRQFNVTQQSELILPWVQKSFDFIARFSPDNNFVVTGGQNAHLVLWDAKSGNMIKQLKGDFNSVADIAFSVDGKLMLTVEGARTEWALGSKNDFLDNQDINLWDMQTGEAIRVFSGGQDMHRTSVIFSPNSQFFCTGGSLGYIDIFDLKTGHCLRSIKTPSRIRNLAYINGGKQILSAGVDRDLLLWDTQTGKLLKRFIGHKDDIRCMTVSANGRFAFSADRSGRIIQWNTKTGQLISSINDENKDINAMAVSPDNKKLATAHGFLIGNEVLKIRTIRTGKEFCNFYLDNAIVSIQFSKLGNSVLAACIVAPVSNVICRELKLPLNTQFKKYVGSKIEGEITDFIITPNQKKIVLGSDCGKIYIKEIRSKNAPKVLASGHGEITFITVSPFNKFLALAGTSKGKILVIDLKKQKMTSQYQPHNQKTVGVVFFKDTKRVATLGENGAVCIWDIQNGKILNSSILPHPGTFRCIVLHPNESIILIGGESLNEYDIKNNAWKCNLFEIPSRFITSISWSPDLKKINVFFDLSKQYEIDIISKSIKITHKITSFTTAHVFTQDNRFRLSNNVTSDNNFLELYDQLTKQEIQKVALQLDQGESILLKFSLDQKFMLYLGRSTGIFGKIPIDKSQILTEFKSETLISNTKALAPDGKYVYTQKEQTMRRVQLSNTNRATIHFSPNQDFKRSLFLTGPNDLVFSNDSDHVFQCSFDSLTVKKRLKITSLGTISLAISKDRNWLATASANKRIGIYNYNSGVLIKTFTDSLVASGMAFSNNNSLLFIGNQKIDYNHSKAGPFTDGLFFHSKVYLSAWDILSGKRIYVLDYGYNDYKFIKPSPDGNTIIAGDVSDYFFFVKRYSLNNYKVMTSFESLYRGALNANYSNNSQRLALCLKEGNIEVNDISGLKEVILTGHKAPVEEAVFSADDRYIFSRSSDHMVKAWDANSGNELYSFFTINDTNWLYQTPDNYYYTNKGALRNMAWTVGTKRYEFEQFDLKYNRPDIVLARIPYADTSLIPLFKKAYEKRLKKLGFTEKMLEPGFHVPELSISNLSTFPHTTSSGQIKLAILATDSKENLNRIHVSVNDVPVYGFKGLPVKKQKSLKKTLTLKLSNGDNKVEVSVMNARGIESTRETFSIHYEPKLPVKPTLYFIGISVSNYRDSTQNLKYAVKDGRDMAKLFSKPNQDFKTISIDTLFNEQVTLNQVKLLKQKLLKTKVNDQVILYISGHGILDDSLNFYFGSYAMNFRNPAQTGISYDVLESLLDGIPARQKLLLMDACHSGETDKDELLESVSDTVLLVGGQKGGIIAQGYKGSVLPNRKSTGVGLKNSFELMQNMFSDLHRGSGAIVISAAAGQGYALESDEWNNGVFTYCILNGLVNRAADANRDHEISVSELKSYVSSQVEILTKGRQKPTSRRENIGHDFRIW